MVVIGSPRDYKSHPTGKDVRLVVERSDMTLRQDRHTKARLYARGGVVEYWILILKTRVLEVRREPSPSPEDERRWEYRSVQVYQESESVTTLYDRNRSMLVTDLLP